MDRHDEA